MGQEPSRSSPTLCRHQPPPTRLRDTPAAPRPTAPVGPQQHPEHRSSSVPGAEGLLSALGTGFQELAPHSSPSPPAPAGPEAPAPAPTPAPDLSSLAVMTPSSLGMRSAALTASWCPSTLLSSTGRLLCGREWISAAILPRPGPAAGALRGAAPPRPAPPGRIASRSAAAGSPAAGPYFAEKRGCRDGAPQAAGAGLGEGAQSFITRAHIYIRTLHGRKQPQGAGFTRCISHEGILHIFG